MDWKYKNEPLKKIPENAYGFVYRITDKEGKMYIGKKNFFIKKGKRLVESNWKKYWGSNEELLKKLKNEIYKSACKREILKICYDKISLTYWEMAIMVMDGVLFSDNYYNGNILGKFYKGKVKP